MAISILIVDDAGFLRRRVRDILQFDPRFEVVGEAVDGQDAVRKVALLRPDAVTMDIEMPIMDGIQATRQIMATHPVPILMFSSFTTAGAKMTLDALDAGAVDYLPKQSAGDSAIAGGQLCDRLFQVVTSYSRRPSVQQRGGRAVVPSPRSASIPKAAVIPVPTRSTRPRGIKLVVIGSSTGGPVALQKVLTQLPQGFAYPILLIQHMPASFTPAFAERLNQLSHISVAEAKDGDRLQAGHALLAPGGRQLQLEVRGGQPLVRIVDSTSPQTYKPSIDLTLESVHRHYPSATLTIILTGMGADGCRGAGLLKKSGSTIWSQDEATSTVYGMPAAVAEAGISDLVLPIERIGAELARI